MTGWGAALTTTAYGVGSAFVPLLNAEAYAVVATARTRTATCVVLVLALAVGQTIGKLVLFEAARRGSQRFATHASGGRAARWAGRIRRGLESRRTGLPLVLAAAALGLPPLAAVSLAAGASGVRRWEFGAVCLVGRTARFGALALPAAWALT